MNAFDGLDSLEFKFWCVVGIAKQLALGLPVLLVIALICYLLLRSVFSYFLGQGLGRVASNISCFAVMIMFVIRGIENPWFIVDMAEKGCGIFYGIQNFDHTLDNLILTMNWNFLMQVLSAFLLFCTLFFLFYQLLMYYGCRQQGEDRDRWEQQQSWNHYEEPEQHTSAYTVLGISQNASKSEIKSAYRKLAKIYHPDVGGDQEKFIRIQRAYKELMATA